MSTPMRCGGYDYAKGVNDFYVDLAYDAVVAIARAANDVVEGGASECVCERVRERSLRQTRAGCGGDCVNYNLLLLRAEFR